MVPLLKKRALAPLPVLALQVVVPAFTVRPPEITLAPLPLSSSVLLKVVVAPPVMEPPVQVLKPLSVRMPVPPRAPPDKSRLVIDVLNDRVEFPLSIIALSPLPGTPMGDQFVSTPTSPVPPNHVRSTAKAG